MKNSFYTFILITSVGLISAVAFEPQLFNQAFAFFGLRNDSGPSGESTVKPHFPVTPLPNDIRQSTIPVVSHEMSSPSFSGPGFIHSGQPQQAGYMVDVPANQPIHQMSLEGNFPPEGFPVTQVSNEPPGSAAAFSSQGNGSIPVLPQNEIPVYQGNLPPNNFPQASAQPMSPYPIELASNPYGRSSNAIPTIKLQPAASSETYQNHYPSPSYQTPSYPPQTSSFPAYSSSVSSPMQSMNIPPSPLGLPTHPADPPFSRGVSYNYDTYSSSSSYTPLTSNSDYSQPMLTQQPLPSVASLPTQPIATPPLPAPVQQNTFPPPEPSFQASSQSLPENYGNMSLPDLPPIQYTTENPQYTFPPAPDIVSVPEISESQYPPPTPQPSSANYQTSVSSATSAATIPSISVNSHDLQVESKIAELEFVSGAEVLAKVGTELILLCDVMPEVRMRTEMIAKERGVPEEAKEEFYREVEKQLLPNILEQKIVFAVYYLDAKTSLPKEQFVQIETSIGTEYDRVEIGRLMEQHEVSTRAELDKKLQSYGSSLEREKKDFVRIYIGRVWLSQSANLQESSLITQQDMIDYYEQHKEEKFRHEARARWEELAVLFSQVPDENQAWNLIAEMGNRVLRGEPFAEVAKKHSHGITASSGGAWDWCHPGSLRSEMLDHAIFTLPPGQLSTIFQDDTGFHIIRVVEREGVRYTPFEKVHNELRNGIREERIETNRKKYDEIVFKKIPITISPKVESNFFSEEFTSRIASAR